MKRRAFLKVTGKTVAGLVISPILLAGCARESRQPVSKAERPNILFIMTDQQHAGVMSCAGNKFLKTPAMDYIASNGMRFEKAYCANPLCVPSRMAMFTGNMPHQTGVTINTDQRAKWNISPMMGVILSEAGYDCGYVGKWHLTVPPVNKELHGFSRLMEIQNNDVDMKIPDACARFLRGRRSKPFLLVASFVDPHDICEWARGQNMRNGRIGDPPNAGQCPPLPDNFKRGPNEPEVIRKVQKKKQDVVYPTSDWSDDNWRQYRWAYYRMVELVDSRIQKVLDVLKETGQEENTVIIFTSDHGDGGGSHHWNQKQVLYEEPARVPFIVAQKGVTQAGAVDSKHLVNTGLDIIPTMCDFAGIDPPEHMKGLSVRPLAERGKARRWRDFLVTETEFCDPGNSFGITGRMLRTEKRKYIVYSEGELREQLFDMQKDPGEMNNLAVDSRYARVLNSHRGLLAEWCEDNGDKFPCIAAV